MKQKIIMIFVKPLRAQTLFWRKRSKIPPVFSHRNAVFVGSAEWTSTLEKTKLALNSLRRGTHRYLSVAVVAEEVLYINLLFHYSAVSSSGFRFFPSISSMLVCACVLKVKIKLHGNRFFFSVQGFQTDWKKKINKIK